MRNIFSINITIYIVLLTFFSTGLFPCSMVLVGKKATVDGSVLLAHNNDLPGNFGAMLQVIPAARHAANEMITFSNGLKIPQVAETYRMLIMNCYYGYSAGDAAAINEYGVAIAGGVSLRYDRSAKAGEIDPLIPKGLTGYIRYIALERSKTARQCVEIMGEMYSRYGIAYPCGVGVADADELWYIEGGGGKCWAAQRVPDDCYLAVANGFRIGPVDFKDKKNFVYPKYLKQLVKSKGLWKPQQGDFDFAGTFGRKERKDGSFYNSRRVWRMQELLSPALQQKPDAEIYPVMVKPGSKISIKDLFALLRDRYQETPFAMTEQGPLFNKATGEKERMIGVYNTVHTDVIQLRDNLPVDIGAVMWAGLASAPTTLYVPYYLGIRHLPGAYAITGPKYDEDSAFWIFRTLSLLVEPRYTRFIEHVLPVWQDLENKFLTVQPALEKAALDMYHQDKKAARDLLTLYSNGLALEALEKAQGLSEIIRTESAKKR